MSTISISLPVGLNAANQSADVIKVQVMLNHFIGNKKLLGCKPLSLDGQCGPKTRQAILQFQFANGLVSEEHFKGQIYPKGKTIAFMNANAGYIPSWELLIGQKDPKGPAAPASPALLELLWEVKTDELAQGGLQRKHLGRLRRFFIRALEGANVDDSYWTFTYYDGMGRQYPCSAKHSIDSVERSPIKQSALRVFQTQAKGATTKDEVGKALRRMEESIACYTFVLTRWYQQNNALGDAPLTDYTEMTYLKEIALLLARNEPESIYAVYGDEIVAIYPVARPIFSADVMWQMRQTRH